MTRPPSMVEHDVAVARVGRLLGDEAPPMRAPTRLERLTRRLTGRYPWSYVDARLDWADAVLDVVEPHGRIRGRRA